MTGTTSGGNNSTTEEFDISPRVFPGSISVKALELALKIEDPAKRFDKIIEITLAATPNDNTAPYITPDEFRTRLGYAKQADALLAKSTRLSQKQGLAFLESMEKVNEIDGQARVLESKVFGFEVQAPENKTDGKPTQTQTLESAFKGLLIKNGELAKTRTLESYFKGFFAMNTLLWHANAFTFENPNFKEGERTTILEAFGEVSNDHQAGPNPISRQAADLLLLGSHDTWERRMNAMKKLLGSDPLSTVMTADLAKTLYEDYKTAPHDARKIAIVEMLSQLRGPAAVDSLARILQDNKTAIVCEKTVCALAKIGHDNPKTAILALKDFEEWSTVEGTINLSFGVPEALKAINESITRDCNVRLGKEQTPKTVKKIARLAGMNRYEAWRLSRMAKGCESIQEMTKIAIDKMGTWHPIHNGRNDRFLTIMRGTSVKKNQSNITVQFSSYVKKMPAARLNKELATMTMQMPQPTAEKEVKLDIVALKQALEIQDSVERVARIRELANAVEPKPSGGLDPAFRGLRGTLFSAREADMNVLLKATVEISSGVAPGDIGMLLLEGSQTTFPKLFKAATQMILKNDYQKNDVFKAEMRPILSFFIKEQPITGLPEFVEFLGCIGRELSASYLSKLLLSGKEPEGAISSLAEMGHYDPGNSLTALRYVQLTSNSEANRKAAGLAIEKIMDATAKSLDASNPRATQKTLKHNLRKEGIGPVKRHGIARTIIPNGDSSLINTRQATRTAIALMSPDSASRLTTVKTIRAINKLGV